MKNWILVCACLIPWNVADAQEVISKLQADFDRVFPKVELSKVEQFTDAYRIVTLNQANIAANGSYYSGFQFSIPLGIDMHFGRLDYLLLDGESVNELKKSQILQKNGVYSGKNKMFATRPPEERSVSEEEKRYFPSVRKHYHTTLQGVMFEAGKPYAVAFELPDEKPVRLAVRISVSTKRFSISTEDLQPLRKHFAKLPLLNVDLDDFRKGKLRGFSFTGEDVIQEGRVKAIGFRIKNSTEFEGDLQLIWFSPSGKTDDQIYMTGALKGRAVREGGSFLPISASSMFRANYPNNRDQVLNALRMPRKHFVGSSELIILFFSIDNKASSVVTSYNFSNGFDEEYDRYLPIDITYPLIE